MNKENKFFKEVKNKEKIKLFDDKELTKLPKQALTIAGSALLLGVGAKLLKEI